MNQPAPSSMPPWPQQPSYPPQAGLAPGQPWHGAAAGGPKRNVGMIVGGAVLLVIALGVGGLFVWNLHTYLTIEDKFAADPLLRGKNTEWVVELVKAASLRRMTIFGSISALFGAGGLVLGGFGLRKK
ncbi:MAG: hypothetical protein KIS78_13440 [Labilithrix sp.]|nr:hypothetical protein [Labilithrix sp.]MCW5833400.1 hypothetical protein [Labilithrix sp.]